MKKKPKKSSILDAIAGALKAFRAPGRGQPSDVWVPKYGWVMQGGKVTAAGERWIREGGGKK